MIGRGGIVFCFGGGTQCYVENTPFLRLFDMKAPDKLYLSPVIYGTITNLSPNPDCEGEVEYIRKDAILEWLKGYNHPITRIVIQEIIDKIDSM